METFWLRYDARWGSTLGLSTNESDAGNLYAFKRKVDSPIQSFAGLQVYDPTCHEVK